ncbi:MAG: alpha-L-rhamnosidase [Cyclobacteriaceae bacterium]|nr:alpha-L-rhamnosidase [Cyclobacteriaceae bacterium]
MKNIYLRFITFLLLLAACTSTDKTLIPAPAGLLCELLRSPELAVITDSIPEFGWIFPVEGGMQKAFRILVASSPDLLEEGKADYWDSGKNHSSISMDVAYGGKPLKANTSYYWKVKAWGEGYQQSDYSEVNQFNTGHFARKELLWPGESRYVQLSDSSWVSENRQTATFHPSEPVKHQQMNGGNYFADFGKASFGTLEIDIETEKEGQLLQVFLGERQNPDLSVNKEPGLSNIGFARAEIILKQGRHTYQVENPPHTIRSPHTQRLAPFYPEVLPFRFVEITSDHHDFLVHGTIRQSLYYPFDDEASYFYCDNENLNQIWDLCKYTLKATPFLGIYADGNRERMPYEADAYIQQLGHYAVDREFSIARYSADFLIHHASWPTEWQMQLVFMAWEDYMHTGNLEFIRSRYEDLKAKSLIALARGDGLISSRSANATPEFFKSIHYEGNKFRDNIDWPEGTPEGLPQGKNKGPTPEGERDGYVITDYNTVINAFHFQSLKLMAEIAAVLGKNDDRDFLKSRAELVKSSILATFFDAGKGIFVDGEGTDHAALHANMFPLAFGLVPAENIPTVVAYVKSKGMACSVYGAQYLLDGLYNSGFPEYAIGLMTSESKRSWMNMIRVGSTMTTEAWDEHYKPNLTWNHAWGSAPANIIVRKIAGIEPLAPGFQKFRIAPQPGGLKYVELRKPSIRGGIDFKLVDEKDTWEMEVRVPGNSEAEIWLPRRFGEVKINGEVSSSSGLINYAGEERKIYKIKSGFLKITAQ